MNAVRDPIGVGIIGAGRIGIVHLEALAGCADAKPIIISNPTVSKAKAAAEKFNLPEFSESDSDVINHPDVEAVWICSPSNFHADQIKACAAAGKTTPSGGAVAVRSPSRTASENAVEEGSQQGSPNGASFRPQGPTAAAAAAVRRR